MSTTRNTPTINPYSPPEGFTRHIEPQEVGGKAYWRCEECGAESITWNAREMYSEFVHRDGCATPAGADA